MSTIAQNLTFIPPDAIFKLTEVYNADSDPRKVNLGQGTYKDEYGRPVVLPCVQLAKQRIAECNHEYLPILGLPEFRKASSGLIFGDRSLIIKESKVACSQTLSGTGALHLAGAFLHRVHGASTPVYITDPSWSNHQAVFQSVGFEKVVSHNYLNAAGAFDFSSLITTLEEAPTPSIFVLHACAHNPSGSDPSQAQWREIAEIMKRRNLFPLFDAAYLGLASGNFDEDAYAIRYFAQEAGIEVGVCLSFAKIMGLYGERTGALAFTSQSAGDIGVIESHLEQLQRADIGNPPTFGARIVSTVLEDDSLRVMWKDSIFAMRQRLLTMRQRLYDELQAHGCKSNIGHVLEEAGMFSILGLSVVDVLKLRDVYHVYMADSSRISIAGLNESNVGYVAKAIVNVLGDR